MWKMYALMLVFFVIPVIILLIANVPGGKDED